MRLLIGTANPAKQKEFARILTDLAKKSSVDLQILFPQDAGVKGDILETGQTFEENSQLKAAFYFDKTGIPAIADDGGIMIDSLGGEPGVMSHRWLGRESTDEELIHYALSRLENFPNMEQRKAAFAVCLTFYDGRQIIQETGRLEGHIAKKASEKRIKSFPYRSVFLLPNGKYYYDLTTAEHERYNHRQHALTRLFKKIIDNSKK